MLTYADLEKALRDEKTSTNKLSPIIPEFYLEGRRLAMDPVAAQYVDSINQMLEQIFKIRANKIVHQAGRSEPKNKPPENIIKSETQLYTDITELVSVYRKKILEQDIKVEELVNASLVRVKIMKALPAIVGPDSIEYGPFRQDDIVELPKESAALLIKRGMAAKEGG